MELLLLFYLKRPDLCKKNSFSDTMLHIVWSQACFPTKPNFLKVASLRTKQQKALLTDRNSNGMDREESGVTRELTNQPPLT